MPSAAEGYVYIIQMVGHPYYKIGRSVCAERRIAQISPVLPTPVCAVLAHRVSDAQRAESALHEVFQTLRLKGEWFRLDEAAVAHARALLLFWQADYALTKILRALHFDNNLSMRKIQRYGRAIIAAARRVDRRYEPISKHLVRRYSDFDPLNSDSSVLTAELVS